MFARANQMRPNARLTGFTVQKMVNLNDAHELIAGVSTDSVFGPVILFGQGGTAVEIIADKAIALPPLNLHLARELVSRTRAARLLAGYRDRPAINHYALYRVLVQMSQLISDIPEIVELDINPLLADEKGVIALDSRIKIARAQRADRFAIRPYPKELEEPVEFDGRNVLLRPIRPEDEPQLKELLAKSSAEDIHFRFFHALKELPHSQLARFTQIDYDREMAFVAEARRDSEREILAEVREVTDPDNDRAEFAILVRTDTKGRGLGRILLRKLLEYCRSRGTSEIWGDVLAGNARMLALARDLDFTAGPSENGSVRVALKL
jgi:acetyltransferase